VPVQFRWPASSRERMHRCQSNTPQPATEDLHTPFSPRVWRDIGDGVSDSDRLLKAGLHGSSWLMSDEHFFVMPIREAIAERAKLTISKPRGDEYYDHGNRATHAEADLVCAVPCVPG
jgi:hypothetical protein